MIKLENEDCYKGIKKIPDKSIDLIITDPPYDMGVGAGGMQSGIFKYRELTYAKKIVDTNLHLGIDFAILDEFVRTLKHIYIYMVQ